MENCIYVLCNILQYCISVLLAGSGNVELQFISPGAEGLSLRRTSFVSEAFGKSYVNKRLIFFVQ